VVERDRPKYGEQWPGGRFGEVIGPSGKRCYSKDRCAQILGRSGRTIQSLVAGTCTNECGYTKKRYRRSRDDMCPRCFNARYRDHRTPLGQIVWRRVEGVTRDSAFEPKGATLAVAPVAIDLRVAANDPAWQFKEGDS
jgi:hypothetical protein